MSAKCRQHLATLSGWRWVVTNKHLQIRRRGRDSNPRRVAPCRFSRPVHSTELCHPSAGLTGACMANVWSPYGLRLTSGIVSHGAAGRVASHGQTPRPLSAAMALRRRSEYSVGRPVPRAAPEGSARPPDGSPRGLGAHDRGGDDDDDDRKHPDPDGDPERDPAPELGPAR